MSEEQQVLLMLKDLKQDLKPGQLAQYEDAYAQIKQISESSDAARFALIMLGAELAAE